MRWLSICIIIALTFWWFSLSTPLFKEPTSTIFYAENNELLSARIAKDGQWRFPYTDKLPFKYIVCLTAFEDRKFFFHSGVDVPAIFRAVKQNFIAKKVVSGGSTITMQTIRLSRKNNDRTIIEKIKEVLLALRLELTYSKPEILSLYASNAPFGGNTVGLTTASWRYFGRSPESLTWAEAATMAVLPNSPSLIYPGKNQTKLRSKRNKLLRLLHERKVIDKETLRLALLEPLPEKPKALPNLAHHLLNRCIKEGFEGKQVNSTIDYSLQIEVNNILNKYHSIYSTNQIHNMAALVLDISHKTTKAYVGNILNNNNQHGGMVDVIEARRSPGSTLKPLLFASMLNEGELLPNMLVADIPTQIAGYSPKNYNRGYEGVVPAKKALARSLNIPAVRMLKKYGTEKFHHKLHQMGIKSIDKGPGHYGLSIILGGAECTMWELAGAYCNLARSLKYYHANNGKYFKSEFEPPSYLRKKKVPSPNETKADAVIDAGSIYQTFNAMVEVSRPDIDAGWKNYSSSSKIAWKTGTSFGFRDAWAVGISTNHVVAVWVGNADGEGRPGLTGIQTAAPVMFDIFKQLNTAGWFDEPYDELYEADICVKSGHKSSTICPDVAKQKIPERGVNTSACPYHKQISTDRSGKYRVNTSCEPSSEISQTAWFILPPTEAWYYKQRNPLYKEPPPLRDDCKEESIENIAFVYPRPKANIYVPIELDGTSGQVVLKAVHREKNSKLFWHLNNEFIGTTTTFHEMAINPNEGEYLLTVIDEKGNSESINFSIVSKNEMENTRN